MQDGIIKGTGNSRFLKSVPDFLSQYPTYESFVAALAAGTLPVDFNGINETGWQQLGTALNKGNLLSDETAAVYGLGSDAVPNDVFMILGIGAGKYGYGITVQYPDGTPAVGLSVSGVTDRMGQPIKTDSNGFFLAVSTEKKITFSVVSPYFDVANISAQAINSNGVLTRQVVEFAYKTYENYVLITSSQNIQFFKDRMVDFTAVGGGGGPSYGKFYRGGEGWGGGGGYVQTILNVNAAKSDIFNISIGSAGDVAITSNQSDTKAGSNGGTTTIDKNRKNLLTANGGQGSGFINGSITIGSGNGTGSHYSNKDEKATDGTGFIFNDSNLGLAGGGGGGKYTSYSQTGVYTASKGGKPFGADGGVFNGVDAKVVNATSAGIGGGGGGGGGANNYWAEASKGGNGGVYLRWK